MRHYTFLVALGAAALLTIAPMHAPAMAQSSTSGGQTIVTKRAPAAAESERLVSWNKIAGNWKRFKGSLKRQWGKLTHDDIAEANGRREILAGKIQARYGIDKDAADRQIEAWLKQQR